MKSSASESIIGTPVSIWNCLAVLFAYPGREFRLWSEFGTALIQTPNFSCIEPNAKLS